MPRQRPVRGVGGRFRRPSRPSHHSRTRAIAFEKAGCSSSLPQEQGLPHARARTERRRKMGFPAMECTRPYRLPRARPAPASQQTPPPSRREPDDIGDSGLLWLFLSYGYVLYFASNLISEGSDLLLLVPSIAGIVGSCPSIGSARARSCSFPDWVMWSRPRRI